MTGLTKRLRFQPDHAAGPQPYPQARRISRLARGLGRLGQRVQGRSGCSFALISFR